MKFLYILLLLSSIVYAKNIDGKYDHSVHHQWYESQTNSLGQWCCNNADGHRYDGDYTINTDGSITIGTIHIPKEKVLTTDNPTGHAVWWYIPDTNGKPFTYCFSPGPLM